MCDHLGSYTDQDKSVFRPFKVFIFSSDKRSTGRKFKAEKRRPNIIGSVTTLTQAQPTPPSPQIEQKPTQTQTQSTPTDTVTLSSSAKAMMEEANETAAQTTQEASRGDVQAQRLLARRAETKGITEKSISKLV
jgi:hypothetical protein